MAIIKGSTYIDSDWLPSDLLRLRIGTEAALNLAASTPVGGTVGIEESPWPQGTRGGLDEEELGVDPIDDEPVPWALDDSPLDEELQDLGSSPQRTMEYQYAPTDKCAVIPVGLSIKDAQGNDSSIVETFEQINDLPIGARDQAIAATVNPNEATLSWTISGDVG